jgi:hypothetical protein
LTASRVWVVLLATLVSCGDGARAPDAGADTSAAGEFPVSGAAAAAIAGADGACPATGAWAECSVVKRLEQAGLVPQVDSGDASEPPLTPRGTLLRVGRADMELYFYPDAAAREREQETLDREKYVNYGGSQTFRAEPTLIGNANLIAVLHSNNSKQRERVGDALTAGPPQPQRQ